MNHTAAPLFETTIKSLPLIHKGKVRDIYAVDDDHMLIVTTDRLSAFDVVLPTPIPGKGQVLTAVSAFWFGELMDIIDNQMSTMTLEQALPDAAERAQVEGRAMVVRRLKALPIEAIVRGYLVGSGWKDYQTTGKVCGIPLPTGMEQAGKLEQPLFTPSSKAAVGEHDENIDFDQTVALIGRDLAEQVRDVSIRLYSAARDHAAARGIIIADT
ncbi:MAG: phosphoribosylaminoimidazolesuccinocarboxamide synthase, partial [Gammaproteobacteria bacterium]|nr:phosphoribosylaminoimidazolesuccinocarboxamide synthase [Gammaproteobacteria bacterium]